MHSIGTLVLFFFGGIAVASCGTSMQGGWFNDIVGGRSVDLGNGLEVQLNKNGKRNASFLESHELKFGYGGVGVSFGKARGQDQLQIGLYADDEENVTGRAKGIGGNTKSKKMGEVLLPAAVGATMSGSIAIMLAAVTVLTLKALALAKLALVISIGFLIAKFMSSHHHSAEPPKEYDFHPGVPVMSSDHTGFGTGYTPSASGNYLAYANYVPGQDNSMDLNGQYSTNSVQALQDTSNASAASASIAHTTGVKRRDVVRPKIMPVITIKKYTYLK